MKPDALRPADPDRIRVQQFFVLVHLAGERLDEFADDLLPAARRLERQAADADIAGHHALAREHFENAQDIFALPEAIEEHGHRTDIQRVRPQPDQVAVEARQLGHHDAGPLRSRRNFDFEELLDRQRVHQVVRKIRQIIDAVGQRHRLLPVLLLEFLLDAGVQEADIGSGADDSLAFEFQHDAQHAVRRGMLRTHVQGHAPRRCRRRGNLLSCLNRRCVVVEGVLDVAHGFTRSGSCTCTHAPDNLSAADILPSRCGIRIRTRFG